MRTDEPPLESPTTTQPLGTRQAALLRALDTLVQTLPTGDQEGVEAAYTATYMRLRWRLQGGVDAADRLLRDHPGAPLAEATAMGVIALLVDTQQLAELRKRVAAMLANEAFLADKPNLQLTLRGLQDQLGKGATGFTFVPGAGEQ